MQATYKKYYTRIIRALNKNYYVKVLEYTTINPNYHINYLAKISRIICDLIIINNYNKHNTLYIHKINQIKILIIIKPII
jgi:hypothetical protein